MRDAPESHAGAGRRARTDAQRAAVTLARSLALSLAISATLAPFTARSQITPRGEPPPRLVVEAQLANGEALDERARASEPDTVAETTRVAPGTSALWRRAAAVHARTLRAYGRTAALDQRIRMNTALGRAYWHAGARARALTYFRAASALWGPALDPAQLPAGPPPGESRIRAEIPDGDLADGAVVRARAAVAEARFYEAEAVFARFQSRRVPIFPGPPTQRAFNAWSRGTLTPFIANQRTALEAEATPMYLNIMSLHALEWELAAAERIAEMHQTFGGHLVGADTPPALARAPALREAYLELTNEMAQRYLDVARSAFDACVGRAERAGVATRWSRRCASHRAELDDAAPAH